jgi:hypothetical protein
MTSRFRDSAHRTIYPIQLEGEIDLLTNELKNGSLYINVPLWGLVNMTDDISGNLGGTILCQAADDPGIKGRFTLSLDRTERKLVIDYVFDVNFVGVMADKIALFPLPAYTLSLILR